MATIEELLAANRSFALGLKAGQAHVLRNAGGVVSDDVIRSLAISQRRFGTHEVMLAAAD